MNATSERLLVVPDANSVIMTVRDLINHLQTYPSDYLVAFQTGDTLGSEEILHLQEIGLDTFFGVVDFVFKEKDEGIGE